MALNKCAANVAASVKQDCENPIVHGYEDVALLFNFSDVSFVKNATNYRQKTSVVVKTGAKPFAIYNPSNIPFADNSDAASFDGLRPSYNKTISFTIPMRGTKTAKDIVEPLLKNREGYVVILATKDRVGDGSFPIIGSEAGAVCTAQERKNADKTTGGEWKITLVEENAPSAEICLFDTDYETSRTEFDRLLGLIED